MIAGATSFRSPAESPRIAARNFTVRYDGRVALSSVNLDIFQREILAIIGPAGSGKTTFLRCLNRMNDLVPGLSVSGDLLFDGVSIYDPKVDVAQLRRIIGMVFAVPVALPGTIYENVLMGPRFKKRKVSRSDLEKTLESALRAAYLWDEVKDRLHQSAFTLSGGQQQRLCLARTIALNPDVILLDEPCSGLDPISTAKIEEALRKLKEKHVIVLVTNNVMQASRISDRTAFFLHGELLEVGSTSSIFTTPKDPRTSDYICGRFG